MTINIEVLHNRQTDRCCRFDLDDFSKSVIRYADFNSMKHKYGEKIARSFPNKKALDEYCKDIKKNNVKDA